MAAGTRHPEKALSARFVETARKPGKYFDGHGLYLKVRPNGQRQWVQRIVIRGKRRELGLGNPSLVPLAEARAKAIENRKVARSGGDPIQLRREAEAVLTFKEASKRVHDLYLPTWRNKKHAQQFINTLEAYAFPHVGRLKISEVATSDVLQVLSPIWTSKPETASRVRQRIGRWRTSNLR